MIDDSVDMLYLQKMVLEMEGFKVLTAQSGVEALELLLHCDIDGPDLILLDMHMGDMNGLDFLTQLEQHNPGIVETVPIVFLTGVDEIPESRAVGSIRKAEDLNKFLQSVRYYIEMGHHHPYRH